jgi:hypothetical protein
VSKYAASGGIEYLKHFLSNELRLISPELVVVTGDLTDAKSKWKLSSQQYHEEWASYYSSLQDARVLDLNHGNFWFDQRGNHDCFDVSSFDHPSNLFRHFSSQKAEGYAYALDKSFGKYAFIGLDACPEYGSRRPFNFFGYLDGKDIEFLEKSSASMNANHTFVLSHYPSGTLVKGSKFDAASANVSAWLSGHLHRLIGGLGDKMYANTPGRYLELELGDMKQSAMFRIMAVDHDVLSFVDLPLSINSSIVPPIVLITSPKDDRFLLSHREPLLAEGNSHYIRFLVWAPTEISKFDIMIDGESRNWTPTYSGFGSPWNITTSSKSDYLPLWTVQWNPEEFTHNRPHHLKICAYDVSNVPGCHEVIFNNGILIPNTDSGSGGVIISTDFNIFVFNF